MGCSGLEKGYLRDLCDLTCKWIVTSNVCQDLERQNESQQETLRKFHLEQRTLMDKVKLLQQQLSQVHTHTHSSVDNFLTNTESH